MRVSLPWPFRRGKQAGDAAADRSAGTSATPVGSPYPSTEARRTDVAGQPIQCWAYTIDENFEGLPKSSAAVKLNQVLSFVSPEFVQKWGLPSEAVYGSFVGDLSAEEFYPNRVFINFMHATIARVGPADPSMMAAAERERDGYVYVIDLRTPNGPQGDVPMEDIVGGFKVAGGLIVPDAYWSNSAHRVFTRNGSVRLPPALRDAMLAALKRDVK